MAEKKRVISYDPVIHAGHILTALSMALSTLVWAVILRADVAALQGDVATVRQQVDKNDEKNDNKIMLAKSELKESVTMIRADMNTWFVRLDEKLDNKQDKR